MRQAQRSPAAVIKQTTGLTEDGLPVHSFRSLLADLATLARNTIITAITPNYPLTIMTRPTPIQLKTAKESKMPWVCYEMMPTDQHELFVTLQDDLKKKYFPDPEGSSKAEQEKWDTPPRRWIPATRHQWMRLSRRMGCASASGVAR